MAERAASAGHHLRSTFSNPLVWIWIAVWMVTRAMVVAQVGFWNDITGVQLQDAATFESWSNSLGDGQMPSDEGWQYPPGAAFIMLLPRIGGAPFGESFVTTMLLFDALGMALLMLLARREGRDVGVWVWLLGIPLLQAFPVLRFDLVPTVIGIAALIVIHRRPAWFGALAGLGATVKVWPAVVLFAEWDRRRLVKSAAAALAAVVLVFAVSAVAFEGEQTGFLTNQEVRGLQVEAVATAPWHLRTLVTGTPVPFVPRNGTLEIGSDLADAVAQILEILALLVMVAAAAFWLARDRAIRRGRADLKDPAVSRDFIFAIVLWLIVTSRVLSPQFMIWLVGLSAVILIAGTPRMRRPAWIVVGTVVLTAGLYQSPANNVFRNMALLFAAIDAAVAMYTLVRQTPETLAVDSGEEPAPVVERTPQPL